MEGKHPELSAPMLPSPLLIQTQELITQAPSSIRFLFWVPRFHPKRLLTLSLGLAGKEEMRKKVRCRNKFTPYN